MFPLVRIPFMFPGILFICQKHRNRFLKLHEEEEEEEEDDDDDDDDDNDNNNNDNNNL